MRLSDLHWSSEILERALVRLRVWTHGKLPQFARRRVETEDVVQEATIAALEHLPEEEIRRPGALEAYVRRSIKNRIVDEIRRARLGEVAGGGLLTRARDQSPGPLDEAMESESERRFRQALLRLASDEQILIVGRVDMNLDYETLAGITGRPSVAATRMATRRAVLKLARFAGAPQGPSE